MTAKSRSSASDAKPYSLKARRLRLDTLTEAHAFMHKNCAACRAEGFSAYNRILVSYGGRSIVATLYQTEDDIVGDGEIGLSEAAWVHLGLKEGAAIDIGHAPPLESFSNVRGRIYGHRLSRHAFHDIIGDIQKGNYSSIQLASFITACAAKPLDDEEIGSLTTAMIDVGDRLSWNKPIIADKHCVGGLPGNRTTPIVVAIAASCGLTIPKTSSRAITSPAGTADMMEVLAPVDLDIPAMRRVVEREGGCIVWGGSVHLSPTDDILIRIERVLDLDAEGQLVASILSKKVAAGATHLVIDIPVGSTAKVRSTEAAKSLSRCLIAVGKSFGLHVNIVISDGTQPIGRRMGPALEARDVLSVLRNEATAPQDLRANALTLAATLLEMSGAAAQGLGAALALKTLVNGAALRKFEAICEAQGGIRKIPIARYTQSLSATRTGVVEKIDNRKLARVAKLAGAPDAKAAGLEIHVRVGDLVAEDQPIYTVHAETPGELEYALNYARANPNIVEVVSA